ncbi:MAG: hypothetical protein ACT4QF_05180 [Sporichthyaceae bacterium]
MSSLPALRRRGPAAALALLVLLTGCVGGEEAAPPAPLPTPTAAPPADPTAVFADLRAAAALVPTTAAVLSAGLATTGSLEGEAGSAAADLRAALHASLVESVHLTAFGAVAGYRFGDGSDAVTAVFTALRENGSATTDVLLRGRIDASKREELSTALEQRNLAQLAYAAAADDGSAGETARRDASARLLANAKDLGRFFSVATDGVLSSAAVQRDFVASATRIAAVLDALGTGSLDAPTQLRTAGEQAGALAAKLAAGLDRTAELAGDPNQTAPTLRAELAGLLTEGVYLGGLSAFFGYTSPEGAAAPAAVKVRDAADATAQSLATAVGATIGRDRQAEFISQWRTYVDDLHGYAAGDETGRSAAGARLAGFPGSVGAFLADASKGSLDVAAVTGAIAPAVQAMIKALDALRTLQSLPIVTAAPVLPSPAATSEPSQTPAPSQTAAPSQTPAPSESASPATPSASPSSTP